jgi:DNA topoisomerase-3
LQQAFARLKPNAEMRPLYEAAVARQQADQIFNLSLTRTATKTLVPAGVRGVIGIGRVKTPTLAIVCLRELEIANFRPEDYFEIVAKATVANGAFLMRHAPSVKNHIQERAKAEAIARAAAGHRGPLDVSIEEKRQTPPRLFDLPSLQKTCGQRWGWTADKTLSVAQELYDGEGKKLITYPRAEARYLSENQIGDAPAIVAALTRLRGFAHLEIASPMIRRGKSGHFCDRAPEGISHHAVVPNVNILDDLESRLARLSDDEKRLFALICRSYLAAVMPDYQYRQTVVTMMVPVPGETPAEFRAIGRVPLRLGWKAVYQAVDPEANSEEEQTLPLLSDGEAAALSEVRLEAKRTQPPPRYNEGTLVDAMQNAWRFVENPALRDRLKEAKGHRHSRHPGGNHQGIEAPEPVNSGRQGGLADRCGTSAVPASTRFSSGACRSGDHSFMGDASRRGCHWDGGFSHGDRRHRRRGRRFDPLAAEAVEWDGRFARHRAILSVRETWA